MVLKSVSYRILQSAFYIWGIGRSKYESYKVPTFSASKIMDGLYLGNIHDALNEKEIRNNDITHIVTAIIGVHIKYNEINHINVPLMDIEMENISQYFNHVNNYIDQARLNGGTVLVHCIEGKSRSASLVAAYLMQKYNLTSEEALNMLYKKRPIVQPNDSFKKQLKKFETFI